MIAFIPDAPTLLPASAGAVDVASMLSERARLLAEPERLHPALWRAQGQGLRSRTGWASGFPALDAQLPDGGWPSHALTELLLPQPGMGEMRLLAPVLSQITRAGRCLMLVDPPADVGVVGLAQLGIPAHQCIVMQGPVVGRGATTQPGSRAGADMCWALEQSLRSGHVGAVVAWPAVAVRPEALRRLQLAAQAHEGPAFLLREIGAAAHPSPAPLRLTLQAGGPDELALRIVKRRGPTSLQQLRLSLAPVLSERARSRAAVPWRWAASPAAVTRPA